MSSSADSGGTTVRGQWSTVHKGLDASSLERAILNHLEYSLGADSSSPNKHDLFIALSMAVRDLLMERWLRSQQVCRKVQAKRVYYFSLEFLIGRLLGDALQSQGVTQEIEGVIKKLGYNLSDILEEEPDAGLGNGGLGRLAACFMESLATLNLPAFGYGIRYEFGLFHQKIVNGFQFEEPDRWLNNGDPWSVTRQNLRFKIRFYGRVVRHGEKSVWEDTLDITAIPHDVLVPGFKNNMVNALRLWTSTAPEQFDLEFFNDGDYMRAWERIVAGENISKVLYPRDDKVQGKELRLKQEYFFASASIQDILRRHLRDYPNLDNLAEKVAIQLNDTHPSIGIPEMMRLLIDVHGFDWAKAWKATGQVFSYTNHTLMSEALEKWPVELLEHLLPRHMEIIYRINDEFLKKVVELYPNDLDRIRRMSLIEEEHGRNVRMGYLAIVGSHTVNGVARLHSELLKSKTFKDFYEVFPRRFTNKTNGITQRRWLLKANPQLSGLITEKIGNDWINDLHELRSLEAFVGDEGFRRRWQEIRRHNKERLARVIKERNGIDVNPASLFDCQVKRIHEYKRQHLNLLQVITHYLGIKSGRIVDPVPRTCVFAGKAAPGYFMAKLIIKLIHDVANTVNNDPDIGNLLKVVFLGNYNVSMAEIIFSGADLSEQISTAGTEASGTGNMKFCLNGALTIGTMDGANIEIAEQVGQENIFIFGMLTEEVAALQQKGYKPWKYLEDGSPLGEAIDKISNGYFSGGNRELFKPFVDMMTSVDHYMAFADFESYQKCQREVDRSFRQRDEWTIKSIRNTANSGKFSSDRTIRDYAQEIWKLKPIEVEMVDRRANPGERVGASS